MGRNASWLTSKAPPCRRKRPGRGTLGNCSVQGRVGRPSRRGLLRRDCDACSSVLVRAEAQQSRDVAGVVVFLMVFDIEQLDIATDGVGNNSVAHVLEFGGRASANRAVTDDV